MFLSNIIRKHGYYIFFFFHKHIIYLLQIFNIIVVFFFFGITNKYFDKLFVEYKLILLCPLLIFINRLNI